MKLIHYPPLNHMFQEVAEYSWGNSVGRGKLCVRKAVRNIEACANAATTSARSPPPSAIHYTLPPH